ncbi:MAG: hypothetical protein KC468_19225, partial [Myxococcales bacterium]|nr:hypothetical protein [Myxococcales bacterium]
LLDELARDSAGARRRWLGVGSLAGAVLLGGVALSWQQGAAAERPCGGYARELVDTWNGARAERAASRVLSSGLRFSASTWTRIKPQLDAYAASWVDVSASQCEAHRDGRLSSELFDRSTACLAERRASLDELVGLLEQADAAIVENATSVVAGLPDVPRCADVRALTGSIAPPEDDDAAQVQAQRLALARASVLTDAGRYEGGASGIDDCAEGVMCWGVDQEGDGTCVELCTGSSDEAMCAPPGTTCIVINNGSLNLCLPGCNPLLQDCVDEVCIGDPNGDGFVCLPDASGGMAPEGTPCEFANACNTGNMCVNPDLYPNPDCQGWLGCCAPFCDLDDPQSCSGLSVDGVECVAYHDPGTAPEGLENVGVCGVSP